MSSMKTALRYSTKGGVIYELKKEGGGGLSTKKASRLGRIAGFALKAE